MDPDKGFLDDVQAGFGQQVVDVGHPAIGRVFHRQHRKVGLVAAHGLDHVLEGAAGQGFHGGPCLAAGFVAVGAGFALKGDAVREGGHGPLSEF